MSEDQVEGRQVLLIEDDVDINESLADILREEGFSVSVFQNGAEALKHLESGASVDAVLLDLMMPVMTGTEFLAAAKKHLTTIPVVVMSAVPHAEYILPNQVTLIPKPFSVEELLDTLRQATQSFTAPPS